MKRRILATFLSLCLLLGLLPTVALADDESQAETAVQSDTMSDNTPELLSGSGTTEAMSGDCGATESDTVTWKLEQNNADSSAPTYTLTISGSGAMADYAKNSTAATDKKPIYTSAPWRTASVVNTESVLPGDTTYGGTYYTGITRIVVESGVTRIGSSAFSYMKDVKEVSIADSVTSIGDRAFMYNYSLESITIPDSVKMETLHESNQDGDGELLLGHCYSLKNVTLGSGFTVIPCRAFEGTNIRPEQITMDRSKITGIGTQAFYNNTMSAEELDLTSFSSLKELKTNTFSFWTIERVKFPASLEELGSFNTVKGLSEVNWTDLTSLKEIAGNAFKGTEIKTADLSNTKITTIDWGAFENCGSLVTVILPDTITTIGSNAFIGLPAGSTITVAEDKYTLLTGKYNQENTSIITVGASIPGEEKTIGLTHNGTTTFFSSLASAANNAVSGDTIFATGVYTFGDDEVAVVRAGVTLTGENLSGYGATFANDERTAYCGTLQTALASCEDGDTVTLNRDVTVSGNIRITKSVTIDLNQKTVTSSAWAAPFLITSGVTCTIRNGKILNSASNNGICVDTQNDSITTLSNVTLENSKKSGNIIRIRSGIVVLDSVTMTGQGLYTVVTNGENAPTVFFTGTNQLSEDVIDSNGTWSLYFDSSNTDVLTQDKSNAIRYFLNCALDDLTSYSSLVNKEGKIPLWYSNSNLSGDPATSTQTNDAYYAKWIGMDDIELQYGGEQQINVSGVNLSDYQSDDPSVATVDDSGTVTATGVGTATISANGNYNEQTTTFKMTVTVTPRVLTYALAGSDTGSGSITYNYSGGHHALADSLTFKWADESGTEVTLVEGTDINYTYTVSDPEAPDGGTAQTYDYLPMPVGTYNNVKFNLLNENYIFAPTDNSDTRNYLEIDVNVVAGEAQRAYLASAAPKANQKFVYTGQGVLPVEGTLNAYTEDSTSSGTVDIGTFTVNIEGLNDTSFQSEVGNIASGTDLSAISGLTLPTEPGTYIITASATNSNYYLYKSLVFTISKATVTIKADDKTIYVGDVMPELTYTVSGLASGDNLSGTVSLSCDAADTNTAGTYTITPSGGDVNTAHYTLAYENGTLTISTRSSGGGSSSGGSSSSNVSGSGDDVSISASGGTVTTSQMENAVKKADEGAAITIKATGSSNVSLPTSGLESATKNDNSLTLDLRYGEVTLSPEALSSVANQAGSTVTLTVTPVDTDELNSRQQAAVGDAPVFDLTIRSGSTVISYFDGGLVTVSIPYELPSNQDPAGVVVWFMDDNGNITPCETMYDTRTETVIFTTRHFSKYVIGYEEPTVFTDVSEDAYYADAVLWAVANGVTNGTSATTFSPDMAVSRAQMVTFLWRAHGSPEATGTNPFTDVSTSDYYYDAVLWAVANGVTNGTSATTFSPDMAVTRAQAVTFQWRAAGSPVASGSSFDDVAADAYYGNAVTWAVANGITNGTSGTTFSPDVVVSRAQAVTFLWRELA